MTRILTSTKKRHLKPEEAAIEKLNRWITEGSDFCSSVHERSIENNEYVAGGTQWRRGDIEAQEAKDHPPLVLNKLRPVGTAIANRQMTELFGGKVFRRRRQDHQLVEGLDEFLRWQRDRAESEHEESAAFRSNVVSGYS